MFTTSLPDPIILISLDGFRPDYLDKNITPNINYLGKMILSFIARERNGYLTYFTLSISVQGEGRETLETGYTLIMGWEGSVGS